MAEISKSGINRERFSRWSIPSPLASPASSMWSGDLSRTFNQLRLPSRQLPPSESAQPGSPPIFIYHSLKLKVKETLEVRNKLHKREPNRDSYDIDEEKAKLPPWSRKVHPTVQEVKKLQTMAELEQDMKKKIETWPHWTQDPDLKRLLGSLPKEETSANSEDSGNLKPEVVETSPAKSEMTKGETDQSIVEKAKASIGKGDVEILAEQKKPWCIRVKEDIRQFQALLQDLQEIRERELEKERRERKKGRLATIYEEDDGPWASSDEEDETCPSPIFHGVSTFRAKKRRPSSVWSGETADSSFYPRDLPIRVGPGKVVDFVLPDDEKEPGTKFTSRRKDEDERLPTLLPLQEEEEEEPLRGAEVPGKVVDFVSPIDDKEERRIPRRPSRPSRSKTLEDFASEMKDEKLPTLLPLQEEEDEELLGGAEFVLNKHVWDVLQNQTRTKLAERKRMEQEVCFIGQGVVAVKGWVKKGLMRVEVH